jgi:CcmD family protein
MQGLPMQEAVKYVAAAYIGIWLVVVVYVSILASQLGQLRREVRLLADTAAKRGAAAPSA